MGDRMHLDERSSDDDLKLPENFEVGRAVGGGNCFFDSFKQGIEQQLGIKVTVEQLRKDCQEFAQNNPPEWFTSAIATEWFNFFKLGRILDRGVVCSEISGYYRREILNSNRWGDPDIEGRILCQKYNVRLHVVKKESMVAGGWIYQIISETGSVSRDINNVNYNQVNTIYMVKNGDNAHFEPILNKAKISSVVQQSSSSKYGIRRKYKEPKPELIEMFLFAIDEFKHNFETLLEEIPKKHPVPYDEFFIYFFLGSAITLPDRLREKVGIKEIYFNLSLEDKKSIKLIFDVNKDNQNRRLVFRTINVNVNAESEQSNFNKDDQSDDDIKEIAKKLCLADQSVNLPEIDEKSFHLSLTKSERLLEIKKVQYVKEALQKIQEEERIKQPSLHGGNEEKFKAVGWQDEELTKWFRRNENSKSRFEHALEMLSKETEEVKKGVEEIFDSFIEICRKEKNFPQKQRDKNEKKGQNRNDQYKESRFHGFIYGTLMLNFKSLYHLNCYAERFSGMGGGADLVLISRKDEYRNRNLNAVPVIVELKVDKNVRDACEQVKSNIVPSVRTFAEKAIIAGVSLLSNEKGSSKKWLPLIVEEHNIPNSEGFITLLLKNINDSNLSKDIQSKNIQEGLKYLHYLIPGIDRISYPQLGYRHRNYLSRLILGEILASSSELNKLVFIHRDEDVSEKVTTLLLHQNDKNLIVILNIIELNTKDKGENNFKLNKAVPLFTSNEAKNINSVYQINIKIDFRNSDFRNENSKGKSYLQEDIKVEKFDLGEYKCMSEYTGEFIKVGNIDCISLNKEGKLELVKKENLINNLNKVLFPVKELITGVAGGDELIAKRTNINFLAVIQGLFTGKQNIANGKNQIIKILPKVNIAYKELIDLAISIANKNKSIRENEVVFIYTSKPDTITEYLLYSLTDKMLPKLYLLKFNSKTKDENNLITIDTRGLYIRHNSYNRDNIIDDLIDYIVDNDIKGFDDLLKNELNELLKSDTDREHTLESLHNIATTLYDRGGYEWVLRICEEIYKIQKDILIPDHPDALSTRHIMAEALENQGKYDEALKTFKEVYEERKKILGEDNFDTLITWYNIARVLKLQGKYDDALQSYKEVYEIQKNILGYDHPLTLATLKGMGDVLSSQGKYNKALQTLREVFDIQKKILSLDHVNTLDTLTSITILLKIQGKYKKALQMFNDIFIKTTKICGTNHELTLITSNNRALVYSDLGKYEEALKVLYEIYGKRKDIFGPYNPETLGAQYSIGIVLYHQGKYEEAIEIFNKVYERRKKIFGPEHLDTLRTCNAIAIVLIKLDKYEEAIQAINMIYDVQKRTLGENNYNTLLTLNYMSQVLFKQGKHKEALEVLQKVLNEEKKVRDNDLNILKTKNCIAQVFFSLGKYEKVFQTYKEVYKKRKDILGSDHHDTLSIWNNMKVILFNGSTYKYKYEDQVVIQLNLAIQCGDKDMVESLIKRGCDVNIQARNKVTPLHLAVLEGHIEIIKLLLKNGANIEAVDINGWRPLHYAALFNNCLNTVNPLLEGGANINAADEDNRIPLYYTTDNLIKKVLMSTRNLFIAIKIKQNKSKIQELLKNGASVNAVSSSDRLTVLHFAVYNGNIDIVNVLLQNRANAIRVTNKGNTPLHISAQKGLLQHIKQVNLNEMSNFINAQTIVGATSLHVAAQNNNKEIVEILLKNGAHYDIKNTQGKTPLDLAKPESDVKNLLDFINQLFQAVCDNKKDLVNSLLKGKNSSILKAILNARNIDKKTIIQVAIFNQQRDIAKLLIKELKAIQSFDQQKTDPLQFEV